MGLVPLDIMFDFKCKSSEVQYVITGTQVRPLRVWTIKVSV